MAKNILLTALLLLFSASAFSQENQKKFWVSGTARGLFNLDELNSQVGDSTTAPKSEYGHTLVDLSANIRPNKNTFIRTTLRVRNEYGGFWGSGITFDVRELYLKGLIANSVRYQIGDINYKLTPFTFYNNTEELYENSLDIFNMYADIFHYDLFYDNNNSWRQQGIATDFSLSFREGIEELQFNMFSSRLNFGGGATDDRLFFGGNVTMVQSKNFSAGVNYINLMDIAGTSKSTEQFENPVVTGTYKFSTELNDVDLELTGESGVSRSSIENHATAPVNEDFFNYAKLSADLKPFDVTLSMAYRNVGPEFRSVGAQARRLKYTTQSSFYTRYTNDEIVRPIGMWDIYNDASIYNTKISEGLDNYYPQYNNVDPYGLATPNRKGFDFSLARVDDQGRYTVNLDYGMLSDVIGQGIDDLRKYNTISAQSEVNVHQFIEGFDRKVLVQLGYTQTQTKRTSSLLPEANSDLNSERINAGITIQLTGDLDLMAGYESFVSTGNDQIADRNQFDEIKNLVPYEVDLSETITGVGLRYMFNENNDLQILWQEYNWSNSKYFNLDNSRLEEKPDYGFNRIAVAFKMKF